MNHNKIGDNMKNISLWKDLEKIDKSKNTLTSNIETDILIIGGGMSGLSTAIELLEKEQKFIIVEKKQCGLGITANSTGKLTFAQGIVYDKIMKNYDYITAFKYYKSQKDAMKKAHENIQKYDIDCDYEVVPSYVFTNKDSEINKIKKEQRFYDRAKVKYRTIYSLPNNYPLKYGLEFEDTAIFNPLKYVCGLKKVIEKSDNKIYENTTVHEIKKLGNLYEVITDRGSIYAKKVIVTCHYPFFIIPGLIPFKTYIDKSYILATKMESPKISAITSNKPTISMRNYKDDYFIFSTNSHSTSNHYNYKKQFDELMLKYGEYFNNEITHIWSNHDVMTNDHIPYIGKVNNEQIYIATGFNKWGMTNGIISGKIITDLILNRYNPYSSIFSFKRRFSILRILNLIMNDLKTGFTLISTKIVKNHKFYDHVEVVNIDGEAIGIYYHNGKEYRVKNTCPHMKCSLIFNEVEKTWDCPCHGSRFDIKGNVITGPSTYSIKLDKK